MATNRRPQIELDASGGPRKISNFPSESRDYLHIPRFFSFSVENCVTRLRGETQRPFCQTFPFIPLFLEFLPQSFVTLKKNQDIHKLDYFLAEVSSRPPKRRELRAGKTRLANETQKNQTSSLDEFSRRGRSLSEKTRPPKRDELSVTKRRHASKKKLG